MDILVLTPIYPSDDIPKAWTPIVHYFTREWVKQGYEVHVMNYVANFPAPVYWISRFFRDKLSSNSGFTIRTTTLKDKEFTLEGVHVNRIMMSKLLPHKRYSKNQIQKALVKTVNYCKEKKINPICIVSHWANPQLELMYSLKELFKVPTCYIAHGAGHFSVYGKEAEKYWMAVDKIGYRSAYIKQEFETDKKWIKPSFMCYSGIPSSYNECTNERDFLAVEKIAYVGTLIKRKYPARIIPALKVALGNDFVIKYAGEGEERSAIEKVSKELGVESQVQLLGRIERDSVIKMLDQSDLFIMISKDETYGLVYLEAMARGCLTIASRKEGFDGIIKHAYNGFLCEAGNSEELAGILNAILKMTPEERRMVSNNAKETARQLTDETAAKIYLSNVLNRE